MKNGKSKGSASAGSLSPAVPNEEATNELLKRIHRAIKRSKMTGSELHLETGISLAMSRRLVRGDRTDMKLSTLARLMVSKKIDLTLA